MQSLLDGQDLCEGSLMTYAKPRLCERAWWPGGAASLRGAVQRVALLVLVLRLCAGCSVARMYSTPGNEVALTELDKAHLETFALEKRIFFDYSGGAFDVQELLRKRYGTGNRFQNVTIKIKYDLVDVLLNVVTLSLANSKTFVVAGEKVAATTNQPAAPSQEGK